MFKIITAQEALLKHLLAARFRAEFNKMSIIAEQLIDFVNRLNKKLPQESFAFSHCNISFMKRKFTSVIVKRNLS